ncbi:TPA: tRNA (cytidine(34)-2'-O)-methyltransferase [Candidatus Galligastranaerophilus gallistercoris]|nr:tRNA (cytidine(34)-2'-O)-methyltransferase [Candidatus Galligastranaerophilus gallistercoris]
MNKKYLNIVLYEPEIPQNTGNIARLCACLDAKLFLVGRLGFNITDKHLKRSGLDYWDKVEVEHIVDFETFEKEFPIESNPYFLFTTKVEKKYYDVNYPLGSFLIFGPETRGIPEDILKKYDSGCVTIPMKKTLRSLNLSNSVAIGAYEAIRQFGGIQ